LFNNAANSSEYIASNVGTNKEELIKKLLKEVVVAHLKIISPHWPSGI
jgi:hypothetical protein